MDADEAPAAADEAAGVPAASPGAAEAAQAGDAASEQPSKHEAPEEVTPALLDGHTPSVGSRTGATAAEGRADEDRQGPAGSSRNPLDLRHDRLSGVVARTTASGFGAIASQLFEGEVPFAIPAGVMPEFQGHPLNEGEAVEFDIQADGRGKAQACVVKPLIGRRPEECLGQRYRGYIRRFADRWGFLNAAAFDGDLFVHRDNVLPSQDLPPEGQPALRAGQAVEFDVAKDDRNRTVARQITTTALVRPGDCVGKRLRGYIRSFQGAWGFIASDCFAGDLFVHRDSLMAASQGVELAAGTQVEFVVERDHHRRSERNRLVARQVVALQTPQAAALPPAAPQPYYGQDHSQAAAMAAASGSLMHPHAPPLPYGAPYPGMPMQPYPPLPYPTQHYPYAAVPPYPVSTAHQQLAGGCLAAQQPAPLPASQAAVVAQASQPGAVAPPSALPQLGAAGQPPTSETGTKGQLHITTHDWEPGPDQPGQLFVTRGTLVTVSCRADHGWVYAGTVQPGCTSGPASEGWVPQAVVKPVSLCRVSTNWEPEGSSTLGVAKGEIIAVSNEAERGWVYGERLGPKQPSKPVEGWLPKKALEYLES